MPFKKVSPSTSLANFNHLFKLAFRECKYGRSEKKTYNLNAVVIGRNGLFSPKAQMQIILSVQAHEQQHKNYHVFGTENHNLEVEKQKNTSLLSETEIKFINS